MPSTDVLAREAVAGAIEGLPPDFRTVVLLVVVDGLRYRETAAKLSVPIGTVMSRLHRGRQLLRERLRDHAASS